MNSRDLGGEREHAGLALLVALLLVALLLLVVGGRLLLLRSDIDDNEDKFTPTKHLTHTPPPHSSRPG